jgi:plasmid stabilization system protein ParE
MSVPVVLRPVAQDEADEAARWYEGKQAGLGTDFLAELQHVLDVISGQPDRYPLVLGDTREAPVARFPYCVYYRERPGRLVVTAVFHTSRDPSVWQGRP